MRSQVEESGADNGIKASIDLCYILDVYLSIICIEELKPVVCNYVSQHHWWKKRNLSGDVENL